MTRIQVPSVEVKIDLVVESAKSQVGSSMTTLDSILSKKTKLYLDNLAISFSSKELSSITLQNEIISGQEKVILQPMK